MRCQCGHRRDSIAGFVSGVLCDTKTRILYLSVERSHGACVHGDAHSSVVSTIFSCMYIVLYSLQVHPTATDDYIASIFGTHGEVLKVVKTLSHSEHGQGLHFSGHVVMSNEHDAQVTCRFGLELFVILPHILSSKSVSICVGSCAETKWQN